MTKRLAWLSLVLPFAAVGCTNTSQSVPPASAPHSSSPATATVFGPARPAGREQWQWDKQRDPEDPAVAMKNVEDAARRTGGDFDKLEPKYQGFLNTVTGGHGRAMFHDLGQKRKPQ